MTSMKLRTPARRAGRLLPLATATLTALVVAASAGAGVGPVQVAPAALLPVMADTLVCSQSLIFHFTGSEQSCLVPGGVTRVEVVAVGGRGGSAAPGCDGLPATGGSGGWGAQVISPTVSVKPGEQLFVEVGGDGGNASYPCGVLGKGSAGLGGWNGGGSGVLAPSGQGSGGGGGASDVRTVSCASLCDQGAGFGVLVSLASRLVVAAGGGGAGSGGGAGDCQPCATTGGDGGWAGAAGGAATISGGTGLTGVGGDAGGPNGGGAGGMTDPACGSPGDPPPCTYGSSGHLGVGGAGGLDPFGGVYVDGTFVNGYGGGGGGGGYFGGGGGDGGIVSLGDTVGGGGGGGGGSSYGPAGAAILPVPLEPSVVIIPLGGGQTRPGG